jgi:hypothetical protein
MEVISFYGMQWNKRYSVQPDRAVKIVEAGTCPKIKNPSCSKKRDGFWLYTESVLMQA